MWIIQHGCNISLNVHGHFPLLLQPSETTLYFAIPHTPCWLSLRSFAKSYLFKWVASGSSHCVRETLLEQFMFPFFFSFLYDHLKFQENNPNFILLHSLRQKSLWCSRDLCSDKGKYTGKKWKDQLAVFVEEELSCSSHYATDGIDSLMAKKEETYTPFTQPLLSYPPTSRHKYIFISFCLLILLLSLLEVSRFG